MPLANAIRNTVSAAWDKLNNLGIGSHKDALQQHFGNQGTLGRLDIKSLPTLPDIPPAPSQEAAILARAGRQVAGGYYFAGDGCYGPAPRELINQWYDPILPAGPRRTCISIAQAFPSVTACSNPWFFITSNADPLPTYPCSGGGCVEVEYGYCTDEVATTVGWPQGAVGYRYSSTSCAPRPNYGGCTSEPGGRTSVGILDYTASDRNPGPFDSTTHGELNGNYGAWGVIRKTYGQRLWIRPDTVPVAGANQFDGATTYTDLGPRRNQGLLGTIEGSNLCGQIHNYCKALVNGQVTPLPPTTLPPTTQATVPPTPFGPAPGAVPDNLGNYDPYSCAVPQLPSDLVDVQPNCRTTPSTDGTAIYFRSPPQINRHFPIYSTWYECQPEHYLYPRQIQWPSGDPLIAPTVNQTDRYYFRNDCDWYADACYEYAHAQNTGFCAPTTQPTTAPTTAATTAAPTTGAPTDPITPKPSSAIQEPSSSLGELATSSDLVSTVASTVTPSLQESSVAPTLSSSTGAQLSSAQENSVNTPSTAISGESSTSLQQSSTRIITPTLTRSPSATQSASVTLSIASSATPSVTQSNSQISSAIDELMSTFTPSSSAYVDPQTSEVFIDASSSASFAPSSAPITSFGFSSALPQSSYTPHEAAISSYVTAKTSLTSSALASSLFSSSATQSFSSYLAPSSAASTGLPGTTSSVFSPASVLESTPQATPSASSEADYYSGSGSGDSANLTDSSVLSALVSKPASSLPAFIPLTETPDTGVIAPTEAGGLGPCAIAGIAFGAAALPVAVVVGGVAYAGVKAYQYVQAKRQSWYPQAMETHQLNELALEKN